MESRSPVNMLEKVNGVNSLNPEFDRSRLSARENEILDLAGEGLTDIQIGLRLEISASTVNSYWVRIRGKLGHLSRTELVATALRQEAEERYNLLQARYEELGEALQRERLIQHQGEGAYLYRGAIDAMPEALLCVDHKGRIVITNERAEKMFGYDANELLGQPIDVLVAERDQARHQAHVDEHMAKPVDGRNVSHPMVYARHRSGRLFQVIILMACAQTVDGKITTCIVRSVIDEIDSMRRRTMFTQSNRAPSAGTSGSAVASRDGE
jgi:PAS domain S-box-containing protein